MLKIDLRVGESVAIGSVAIVSLEEKSGKIARLAIEADKSVAITRINKTSPAQIAASNGIVSSRKPAFVGS